MKDKILTFALLLLFEWAAFCYGYSFQYPTTSPFKPKFILVSPFLFALAILFYVRSRFKEAFEVNIQSYLRQHSELIDSMTNTKACFWICLSSAIGLLAELLMIRLHSSYFQLFAYLKNVSLLSCFLGLGIGYAQGRQKPLWTPFIIPMFSFQIILLIFLRNSLTGLLLQNPIPDQMVFGLSDIKKLSQVVAVYGFLSFFFTLNALCFIPLGHLASFCMSKTEKLKSYGWNLIGSILSVVIFTSLSFLNTSPSLWLTIMVVGIIIFLKRNFRGILYSFLIFFILLLFLMGNKNPNQIEVYSPYQILHLKIPDKKESPLILKVSNTFFQYMLDLSKGIPQKRPRPFEAAAAHRDTGPFQKTALGPDAWSPLSGKR